MRVNRPCARRCAPPEQLICSFANSRGRRVRLVVSRDGLGDQSEPRNACAWGCRRARLALGDHPGCAGCARCGRDQRIGLVERSPPPARRHATCPRDRRTYRDIEGSGPRQPTRRHPMRLLRLLVSGCHIALGATRPRDARGGSRAHASGGISTWSACTAAAVNVEWVLVCGPTPGPWHPRRVGSGRDAPRSRPPGRLRRKRDPSSTSVHRRTVRASLGEQRATPTTVFQITDIEGGAG